MQLVSICVCFRMGSYNFTAFMNMDDEDDEEEEESEAEVDSEKEAKSDGETLSPSTP